MRTVEEAIAAAKKESENPTENLVGLCLKFVREVWGFSATGIVDANEAWSRSTQKHTSGVPPRGAPVYWNTGPHGHVAISAGGGKVYSTDIRRKGKVDLVPIKEINRKWGGYRGWTGDYVGKDLPLGKPGKEEPGKSGKSGTGTKPTSPNSKSKKKSKKKTGKSLTGELNHKQKVALVIVGIIVVLVVTKK